MEWLDKLRQLKDQIDWAADTGADYLRKVAEVMRKAAEAAEGAADSIDPTPGQFQASAEVVKVEEFVSECEAELNGPRAKAGGALIGILLPFLLEIAREWLKNRKGGAAGVEPRRPV